MTIKSPFANKDSSIQRSELTQKLNTMATFDLVLNEVPYPVPRESVSPLVDHRPDLQNQRSYRVQSPVSQGCFQAFGAAVQQGSETLLLSPEMLEI
jgi:hypothetical protein